MPPNHIEEPFIGDVIVSRETVERLRRFQDLLIDENSRQNLISPSTCGSAWERHIMDGAQLHRLRRSGSWVDIGSGGGLPGLVIASMTTSSVCLVEPRKLRADFLRRAVDHLGLEHVSVFCGKAEAAVGTYDNITARAVASLDKLFALTAHLAHRETKWIFPKGQKAKSELDEALQNWQGSFELVESATNSEAAIVIATHVRPKGKK